ncbi:hypothetical protein EYF80_000456 [Liparis tanakae]|uniref:Uncharacterized protein n=1 Tax=Liparis tanakae TaxID=230148 RepID=A0A4Z2JHQ2_9TELE|nr:hypothetical protein EYF80_000456 [Liparis tanakae]
MLKRSPNGVITDSMKDRVSPSRPLQWRSGTAVELDAGLGRRVQLRRNGGSWQPTAPPLGRNRRAEPRSSPRRPAGFCWPIRQFGEPQHAQHDSVASRRREQ